MKRNIIREAYFQNRFLKQEAAYIERVMRSFNVRYEVELPNQWLTHRYRIPASSVAPLMALDIPDETS